MDAKELKPMQGLSAWLRNEATRHDASIYREDKAAREHIDTLRDWAREVDAALAHSDAAQAPTGEDARNLVTLDRRDLWDHVRGAIHGALHDKIPKDCVPSWAWEEATNRTFDIFRKIVDTAPVAPAAAAQAEAGRPAYVFLAPGDVIRATDERYSVAYHRWKAIAPLYVGATVDASTRPVRRLAASSTGDQA